MLLKVIFFVKFIILNITFDNIKYYFFYSVKHFFKGWKKTKIMIKSLQNTWCQVGLIFYNTKIIFYQMILGIQIKAARSLLKMSQLELSEISGLSLPTIIRLETEEIGIKKANIETVMKIKEALEDRGIKFLPPKEKGSLNGVGVRFAIDERQE